MRGDDEKKKIIKIMCKNHELYSNIIIQVMQDSSVLILRQFQKCSIAFLTEADFIKICINVTAK